MLENIDYVAKKIPRDFQIDGDVEKEIWREATQRGGVRSPFKRELPVFYFT